MRINLCFICLDQRVFPQNIHQSQFLFQIRQSHSNARPWTDAKWKPCHRTAFLGFFKKSEKQNECNPDFVLWITIYFKIKKFLPPLRSEFEHIVAPDFLVVMNSKDVGLHNGSRLDGVWTEIGGL